MVPEEIRKVERPVNTIVIDHGGNGRRRYAVIQRIGCKRVNGRNIPVNGATIGYIYNGVFYNEDSVNESVSSGTVDIIDYADAYLTDSLSHDLLSELERVFSPEDSLKLYVLSCLKVLYPGITYSSMSEKYGISYLKTVIGEVPLSKNTLCTFINNIGRNYSKIIRFMRNRTLSIQGHLLAVDGTVKSDDSVVNSLSQYSRKARTRNSKDISILYAYDIDTMEPVCAKAYPGNVLDIVSYEDFLTENAIDNAVVMGDKAFQRSAAEKAFQGKENLHYLNPLKRNDRRIRNNSMYSYDGMLSLADHDVLYKKAKLPHSYLYSFYDRNRGVKEEKDYFRHHKDDSVYDSESMKECREKFGTVVFESDLDEEPEKIYKMYSERWLIEITFRYYKTTLEFSDTKVQDDFSVYGNEFTDFLSTVITMKLVKKFDETELSKKMTYSAIMSQLKSAKKIRLPDKTEKYARVTNETMETLAILGIEPRKDGTSGQKIKRKRGRPSKKGII